MVSSSLRSRISAVISNLYPEILGYGHATRVSALASHLRLLDPPDRPTIYIVSSAPRLVFSDSIARGALYRYAEIDPVIVQPLA